jgi:hypothetical protein
LVQRRVERRTRFYVWKRRANEMHKFRGARYLFFIKFQYRNRNVLTTSNKNTQRASYLISINFVGLDTTPDPPPRMGDADGRARAQSYSHFDAKAPRKANILFERCILALWVLPNHLSSDKLGLNHLWNHRRDRRSFTAILDLNLYFPSRMVFQNFLRRG